MIEEITQPNQYPEKTAANLVRGLIRNRANTETAEYFEGPPAPPTIARTVKPNRREFNLHFSLQDSFLHTIKIFIPIAIGLVLIVFGLTSTGSFYTSASRFGGVFAEFFYGWQAGTFIAMIGAILIYDAIKRTGYL